MRVVADLGEDVEARTVEQRPGPPQRVQGAVARAAAQLRVPPERRGEQPAPDQRVRDLLRLVLDPQAGAGPAVLPGPGGPAAADRAGLVDAAHREVRAALVQRADQRLHRPRGQPVARADEAEVLPLRGPGTGVAGRREVAPLTGHHLDPAVLGHPVAGQTHDVGALAVRDHQDLQPLVALRAQAARHSSRNSRCVFVAATTRLTSPGVPTAGRSTRRDDGRRARRPRRRGARGSDPPARRVARAR